MERTSATCAGGAGGAAGGAIDGRSARRQRNIDAVVDATLELLAEELMFPTMEQVARRAGLSLRSLYRYFPDPAELMDEAIRRNHEVAAELSRLPCPRADSTQRRVEDFVAMRLRLFEAMAPVHRASVANAARHPRVQSSRAAARDLMRAQFEEQFGPDLDRMTDERRTAVVGAGDVLTQMDSLGFLRHHRGLSVADTRVVLEASLIALLA